MLMLMLMLMLLGAVVVRKGAVQREWARHTAPVWCASARNYFEATGFRFKMILAAAFWVGSGAAYGSASSGQPVKFFVE